MEIKKATEERDEFFELIGTEITFSNDIITIGGQILHNKGDKAVIEDVEYKDGCWSNLCPDIYINPRISIFKLHGIYGCWTPDSFLEYKKQDKYER